MKTNWKRRIFSLVLCLVLVFTGFPVAVYAQEAQPAGDITGSDDVENETPIEVDVAKAEDVPVDSSFTLTDDGEPVLEVTHQNELAVTGAFDGTMMNGFYTADFVMPDTGYNVFLTGLTQDNVEQIKQAIIDNYVEGKLFEMRDLGFIDVEKTAYGDNDDLLCAPAAASNVLVSSGWAAQAGFTNSDDVFEAVLGAFPNRPTTESWVFSWFFDGYDSFVNREENYGFVGYFPQYSCINDLADDFSFSDKIETIYNRLREGYAASLHLNLHNFYDHEIVGGHAVTLWGFVTDPSYPASSKEHYKYIFVTDSDSNMAKKGKDRRTAPDVMSMIPIEYKNLYDKGLGYWYSDPHIYDIMIDRAYTLKPYSPDIPYETSPDATLNRFTAPDIYVSALVVSYYAMEGEKFDELDDEEIVSDLSFWSEEYKPYFSWAARTGSRGNVVYSGMPIYFCPYLRNRSKVDYINQGEGLYTRLTVTDEQGEVVFRKDYELPESISFRHADSGSTDSRLFYSFKAQLPAGEYTATAEFNPNHTVSEALYINNTLSFDFSVRDWYVDGDADGDGIITIKDATCLSRYLANYPCDISENSLKHGDVDRNGKLEIIDATYLQRYVAKIRVKYSLGTRHFI